MNESWKKWVKLNDRKISDGFEKNFVDLVLSNIAKIKPSDVEAQYTFKDSIGKNRRIDFVLKNKEMGFFLAIELDGARRGNDETQLQWADFLQRQNDLLELVGPLLRFSNSQMFKNPYSIIKRIEKTLLEQSSQSTQIEKLSKDYNHQKTNLIALEDRLNNAKNEIINLKSKSVSQRKYSQLELQLKQLNNAYDAQFKSAEIAKIKLENDKNYQLEYALKESDKKSQILTQENNLMKKTMFFIVSIVVLSMFVILSRTNNSSAVDASINEIKHTVTPPIVKVNTTSQLPNVTEKRIPAYEAALHIGQAVMACGQLVEIKTLSSRIYLNLDEKYPSQSLTILIWKSNLKKFRNKFGNPQSLMMREICVYGTIEEYKNNLQIKVNNENFLRLMN